MGARLYVPSLGRFLQVDPVEGGTLNPYVYAHDPVNMEDYSGKSANAFTFAAPAAPVCAGIALVCVGALALGGAYWLGYNIAQSRDASRSDSGSKSQSQTKSGTRTDSRKRTCTNCGVYKFTDTGSTNPKNAGKIYIGKTNDFDRREAQHGGRIAPGSFETIYGGPGQTIQINTIRPTEQFYINQELIKRGASPWDVKSGLLANRINAMSQKSWADKFTEAAEFPAF